jgi:hypothetical protein
MNDIDEAMQEVQKLLAQAELIDESAPPPYGYERIEPSVYKQGYHFRIYDANDNAVATCYSEGHAKLVVRLMNLGVEQVEQKED